MEGQEVKQLIYFPYMSLNRIDEISVDNHILWNFDTRKDVYIENEALKGQIKEIINTNVINKTPVKGVGVVTIKDEKDFTQFGNYNTLLEIRNLTFICSISKWNTQPRGANVGHFMVSSENFMFIIQNFQLGNKGIAVNSGYIVPKLIGGYKIGEIQFQAPQHLLLPNLNSMDWDLFTMLIKTKEHNKTLYRKIHKAIDLFYESQFNNPLFSLNARILLLMSAFETLLDLPQGTERKEFTNIIEAFTKLPNDVYRTYSYGYKKRERRTIKAMWANKFYSLRNDIIHGKKIKEQNFIFLNAQRHTDTAVLFFIISIKKMLNNYFGKKIFWDEIKWGNNESFDTKYTGFLYETHAFEKTIANELNK
jgi:hypothetical protein